MFTHHSNSIMNSTIIWKAKCFLAPVIATFLVKSCFPSLIGDNRIICMSKQKTKVFAKLFAICKLKPPEHFPLSRIVLVLLYHKFNSESARFIRFMKNVISRNCPASIEFQLLLTFFWTPILTYLPIYYRLHSVHFMLSEDQTPNSRMLG